MYFGSCFGIQNAPPPSGMGFLTLQTSGALQQTRSRMNWLVRGGRWSYYAMDYPLFFTVNVFPLSPPFVGLSSNVWSWTGYGGGGGGGALEPADVLSFQPPLPRVLTLTQFHAHAQSAKLRDLTK